MTYKLINRKTNEEHFCEKVTLDGHDYYISDKQPVKGWYYNTYINKIRNTNGTVYGESEITKQVVATTDSTLNLPHLYNEVFSEEDMVEFAEWYVTDFLDDVVGLHGVKKAQSVLHLAGKGVTKEILNLWKEQQIKTIYYSE